eukprot:scaffold2518_cov272-Alexandrium_tamarense.AAC.1
MGEARRNDWERNAWGRESRQRTNTMNYALVSSLLSCRGVSYTVGGGIAEQADIEGRWKWNGISLREDEEVLISYTVGGGIAEQADIEGRRNWNGISLCRSTLYELVVH